MTKVRRKPESRNVGIKTSNETQSATAEHISAETALFKDKTPFGRY